MDFDVAHWTILACLQVFHNTTFTDCRAERKKDVSLSFWGFHPAKHYPSLAELYKLITTGRFNFVWLCLNSQVCKHSVIVVASMKYPAQR